jgi:mercuric ion transport protein
LVRTSLGTTGITSALEHLGEQVMKDRLFAIGILGTIFAALCCFTPVLVILLGATGLSAIVGYLDFVLFPALVIFLAITGYALWRRNHLE